MKKLGLLQLPPPGVGVFRPVGGQVPRRQEPRVGVGGLPAARPPLPGARPRRRGGHLPDAAGHAVHYPRQHTGTYMYAYRDHVRLLWHKSNANSKRWVRYSKQTRDKLTQ